MISGLFILACLEAGKRTVSTAHPPFRLRAPSSSLLSVWDEGPSQLAIPRLAGAKSSPLSHPLV